MSEFDVLQRFARSEAPAPHTVCELCGATIGERHRHVVDLRRRSLGCACDPCAMLFSSPPSPAQRFRSVPNRVLDGSTDPLSEADWAALQIPVRLAFFFYSSPLARWVAVYPGAAGATESDLPMERWEEIARTHPLVAAVQPDVEAVLARAARDGSPLDCMLVPIDVCYELVALVRSHWRGFDGGAELRRELDAFFARLRARSRRLPTRGGA